MTKDVLKSDGARLTIYRDGPEWEGKPAATIGDFSCKSPDAGSQLLDQALDKLRNVGCDRVIGPMSGDTWHNYRFVSQTDGSPQFLMEPTNKPHERDVFRDAGFEKITGYFSARVGLMTMRSEPPPETDTFSVETWSGSEPKAMFRQVFELSKQSFSKNAFYKPISEDEFLAMYMPVVPLIKKELIFFARRSDGSLAGFLFAIPNYAEGPEPASMIVKTYASLERGAGRHMVHACHSAARELGFQTAIHALIHDDNQSADRSAAEGADVFRRYELLGLRLND